MLSERSYWIVLIVALSILIVIDFIWIIPVNRDIGVNLFTDSIFMLFTIIFLSWLFSLREKLRRKPMENAVLHLVASQVYRVYVYLRNLVEPPFGRPVGILGDEPTEEITKNFLKELEEFHHQESMKFNIVGKTIHEKESKLMRDELAELEQGLREIEVKYFQYLDHSLRLSLMRIESELRRLHHMFEVAALIPKVTSLPRYESKVCKVIHVLFEEIYEIHHMGVDILRYISKYRKIRKSVFEE